MLNLEYKDKSIFHIIQIYFQIFLIYFLEELLTVMLIPNIVWQGDYLSYTCQPKSRMELLTVDSGEVSYKKKPLPFLIGVSNQTNYKLIKQKKINTDLRSGHYESTLYEDNVDDVLLDNSYDCSQSPTSHQSKGFPI